MAETSMGNPLQVFSNVVTAAAGTIGLLYIVGVVVIGGRLWLNRLPGESVLSQLPQQYLLAVGLSEVILPTLLFPIVYLLLAWVAHGGELFSTADVDTTKWWRRLSWIGGSGFVAFVLLFGTYLALVYFGLAVNPLSSAVNSLKLPVDPVVPLMIALILLTVIAVLALGSALNSSKYKGLRSQRLGATVGTAVAVTLVALIVWGVNAIATPLDYVKVCEKSTSSTGVLIASTSDTVYIGQYTATSPSLGNLDAFSRSDVLTTVNGTDRDRVYHFVCPTASSAAAGTPSPAFG
jgi:hypothetical protein